MKPKVTPLVAKSLMSGDLSYLPVIQWELSHEDNARTLLFMKPVNLTIISKSHPFLGAIPDNIFIFMSNCCGQACVEFKRPFNIKGLSILEGWARSDFRESHKGKIRRHKYCTQVIGQMASCCLDT